MRHMHVHFTLGGIVHRITTCKLQVSVNMSDPTCYCVLQTEIERLKRQIAEREAAVKAVKAQGPSVTRVSHVSTVFMYMRECLKLSLSVAIALSG